MTVVPPTETPDAETEAQITAVTPRAAKAGVVDRGQTVTGFGGEPINGMLADLADGDD